MGGIEPDLGSAAVEVLGTSVSQSDKKRQDEAVGNTETIRHTARVDSSRQMAFQV